MFSSVRKSPSSPLQAAGLSNGVNSVSVSVFRDRLAEAKNTLKSFHGIAEFPREEVNRPSRSSCQFLLPLSVRIKPCFSDPIAPRFDRFPDAKVIERIFL